MSKVNIKYHNLYLQKLIDESSDSVINLSRQIENYTIEGFEYLSFKDTIYGYNKNTYDLISKKVSNIYNQGHKFIVVICPSIVKLQIENAINFIHNKSFNTQEIIKTFFVSPGDNFNKIQQIFNKIANNQFVLLNYLFEENEAQKKYFELFYNLLNSNIGKFNAREFVYFAVKTSDRQNFYYAKYEQFNTLIINEKFKDKFSFFALPSLFILALNLIDIKLLIKGAIESDIEFNELDIDFNDLLKYVAITNSLKPNLNIYSTTESKNLPILNIVKGMFINVVKTLAINQFYPQDFYSPTVNYELNNRLIVEHMISTKQQQFDYDIYDDIENEDSLNNLTTLSVNNINTQIKNSAIELRGEFGTRPIIEWIFDDFNEETLGHFFVFLQRLTILKRYLNNKNPFQ